MAAKRKPPEQYLKFQMGTYTASFVKLPEMAYWEIYSSQKKVVAFAASRRDAEKKIKAFEQGEESQKLPQVPGFKRNFR